MEAPVAVFPGNPVRNAERIHVGDGRDDLIIIRLGGLALGGEVGVEAAVMLNHAEVRLLRRRLKAALRGNPTPDEVM